MRWQVASWKEGIGREGDEENERLGHPSLPPPVIFLTDVGILSLSLSK